MKYIIVSADSSKGLEDRVNAKIGQSYKPIGGVFIEFDEHEALEFHQAMINKSKRHDYEE